jgi:hypothetical protein
MSVAALADDASDQSVMAQQDAEFDAQFVCPETITDRDARIEELQTYMDWAKTHHPDWNLRKRMDVRYGLLRRHACATTLANLAASQRPAFAP